MLNTRVFIGQARAAGTFYMGKNATEGLAAGWVEDLVTLIGHGGWGIFDWGLFDSDSRGDFHLV